MTIIEQALTPKSPVKRSEDGIVVTPDFVAVIDGSTSKSRRRCHRDLSLRRRSNGELAMVTVAAALRRLPPQATCHQFCQAATRALHRRYRQALLPHLLEHPEDRLTASCVVFSRRQRQLWLIGDCQCLVDGELFANPKPHEQELAEMRAQEVRRLLESGVTAQQLLADDVARPTIIPRMLECMQQQNKTYSVLDGFPVAEQHVVVLTLSFAPHSIVLASDGYPFLLPTLAESEEALSRQRRDDPLNIGPRFMATKAFMQGNASFDDRAYIRLEC